MSAEAFNAQTPQQQVAAAVSMLRANNLPTTTDNLNRAMVALSSGQQLSPATSAVERAVTRSMQPRRSAVTPAGVTAPPQQAPTSAGAGVSSDVSASGDVSANAPAPAAVPDASTAVPALTRGQRVEAAAALPPEQRNDAMPGGRRAGTINAAQRIEGFDEATDENAAAVAQQGMFEGTQPRQADETGVDPVALALTLGIPLAPLAAAGGASMLRQTLLDRARAAAIARNKQQIASGRLAAQARREVNLSRRGTNDPRGELPGRTTQAPRAR